MALKSWVFYKLSPWKSSGKSLKKLLGKFRFALANQMLRDGFPGEVVHSSSIKLHVLFEKR